jgi:signal transduction histidine kinase
MGHLRGIGWRDCWLPALLLLVGVLELSTVRTDGWVASMGLESVAALILVFRRAYPVFATPLSALALIAIPLTGTQMDEVATPIFFYVLGIYSLGRYLGARSGIVVLAVTLGLVFADFGFDPADNDWTDLVFVLSLAVPPYVFGRISRKLAEQAELLARQQEQIRDQAVRAERDRIARELHDVIAHSVTAMVVQTAAAQDLVRSQPDRAAELLDAVAATGRDALAETGRLLHLVRDDSDELGLQPAPGLHDVPALVDRFRGDGLAVEADLELPARQVPGSIEVSAYRVVQETLTNALKHGDGGVDLTVTSSPHELRIASSNAAKATAGQGSGLGLQGMAERVGVLGGQLRHGRNGDGRFRLEVTIPLRAEDVE